MDRLYAVFPMKKKKIIPEPELQLSDNKCLSGSIQPADSTVG